MNREHHVYHREYQENEFSLIIDANTFTVLGSLENFNYEKMAQFMKTTAAEIPDGTIVIDFSSTRYINSVGIRIFALFIFETEKNIWLKIDHSLEWQNDSLGMLSKLKPHKITVI